MFAERKASLEEMVKLSFKYRQLIESTNSTQNFFFCKLSFKFVNNSKKLTHCHLIL